MPTLRLLAAFALVAGCDPVSTSTPPDPLPPTVFRIASVTHAYLSPDSPEWRDFEEATYGYDGRGFLVRIATVRTEDGSPRHDVAYVRDEAGRWTEFNGRYNIGSEYEFRDREWARYDAMGRFTETRTDYSYPSLTRTWDTALFRSLSAYDGRGLLGEVAYLSRTDTTDWRRDYLLRYAYNADSTLSERMDAYVDSVGAETPAFRTRYTYADGKRTARTTDQWASTSWQPETAAVYRYDRDGNVSEIEEERLDEAGFRQRSRYVWEEVTGASAPARPAGPEAPRAIETLEARTGLERLGAPRRPL